MAANLNSFVDGSAKDCEVFWVSISAGSLSCPDEGSDLCLAVEEGSLWFRHRESVIGQLATGIPPADGPILVVGSSRSVADDLGQSGEFNISKRGLDNTTARQTRAGADAIVRVHAA